MGEIFAKLILFFFGFVAARFGMMIVDSNDAKTARLQAQRHMFHLAAYIQHDLGQGVVFDPAQYPAKLKAALAEQALEDDFAAITCHEIPVAERRGDLKGVSFYLYDPKVKMGVLANGLVFRGEFDKGKEGLVKRGF